MINLYFGNPCDEWTNEMAEKIAINHDVSFESAIQIIMSSLVESLTNKGEEGFSYFDDRFGWAYEQPIFAPKIALKRHFKNGFNYPMLSLSKNYVLSREDGSRMPITDEALTIFGKDFELAFGIEYLGYSYSKKRFDDF